jgi:hypothetical protein
MKINVICLKMGGSLLDFRQYKITTAVKSGRYEKRCIFQFNNILHPMPTVGRVAQSV